MEYKANVLNQKPLFIVFDVNSSIPIPKNSFIDIYIEVDGEKLFTASENYFGSVDEILNILERLMNDELKLQFPLEGQNIGYKYNVELKNQYLRGDIDLDFNGYILWGQESKGECISLFFYQRNSAYYLECSNIWVYTEDATEKSFNYWMNEQFKVFFNLVLDRAEILALSQRIKEIGKEIWGSAPNG